MNIQQSVPLAPFTTFGIGGPADHFVIATSLIDMMNAIRWSKEQRIPFFVLGRGANILVGDKGFRGLVIKNEAKKASIAGTILTAESGALIHDLIQLSVAHGLSGLEHFAGIPSTVGGALWQNLHFVSPDRSKTLYIGDSVLHARIFIPETGDSDTVEKEYFHFGYDSSTLHTRKDVVLTVDFQLHPQKKLLLQKTVTANINWRREKHPENATKKSAGSVFKKIEDFGAGRLIEQVGLKGKKIGGAEISQQHANFIINTGNATARDVRMLITLVQEKVKKELKLTLEPEISFVGEF